LVRDAKLRGPALHDARIAALCRLHGVHELWTADRRHQPLRRKLSRAPGVLTVTSEPVAVVLPWADFVGGSPEAAVDPRELTAIAWSLPAPGDTPYGVDLHIDDLRFVVP
jgi:hypothetical protein